MLLLLCFCTLQDLPKAPQLVQLQDQPKAPQLDLHLDQPRVLPPVPLQDPHKAQRLAPHQVSDVLTVFCCFLLEVGMFLLCRVMQCAVLFCGALLHHGMAWHGMLGVAFVLSVLWLVCCLLLVACCLLLCHLPQSRC